MTTKILRDGDSIDNMFEEVISDINRTLIENARANPGPTITLAVGVLTLASGERRLPHVTMEYGDGEGERQVKEFIENSRRFLHDGESLDHAEITIPVCELGL